MKHGPAGHRPLVAALVVAAGSLSPGLPMTVPPVWSAASSSAATEAQAVQIKSAWIRWLPGGVPLAGYATLVNVSDRTIVLTSATSGGFRDVSLHQTLQSGGSVRMTPLERIAVRPHDTLDFEAHGIHLMLMEPRETLDPREAIPVILHFDDGSSLTVPFQVRTSAGASSRG
jgi:periplasmic copper chaperone A